MNKAFFPGPFSTKEESQEYLKIEITEVKYVKLTCLSLKITAQVFRLIRDHKYLETKGYAENVMPYLCNSRSSKSLTLDDLTKVLNGVAPTVVLDSELSEDDTALGEQAAVYLYEEKV